MSSVSTPAAGVAARDNSSPSATIYLWYFFHILGAQILLPVLVATFVFSRAKRDATLISLCATFILTGICSCLLLYAGEAVGPEPGRTLCTFQAATSDASPPMWATATLALVLQVQHKVGSIPGRQRELPWLLTLLCAPYAIFIIILITDTVVGWKNPSEVSRARRKLYCSINNDTASTASALITTLISTIAVAFGGYTCIQSAKCYRYLRRVQLPIGSHLKIAIRLAVFMLYLLVALIFSLWSILDHTNTTLRDMYTATFSIACFLVFGTQRDVFRVWCFWRRDAPEADSLSESGCPTGAKNADVESIAESAASGFSGSPESLYKEPSPVVISDEVRQEVRKNKF